MPVECQRPVRLARRCDRDRLALLVISAVGVGDYDIEPVDRAAQQNDDQAFRALIGHRRPRIWPETEGGCRSTSDEMAPVHETSYRRIKSGLPRISAARRPFGDSSRAARVLSKKEEGGGGGGGG